MRKEVETDFWVGKMLENYGINFVPQGSTVHEIQEALKNRRKRGLIMLVFQNLWL